MGRKTENIYFSKERFNKVLRLRETNMNDLGRAVGLEYQSLKNCKQSEWINPIILKEICKHLNVSFEYLTGTENETNIKDIEKKYSKIKQNDIGEKYLQDLKRTAAIDENGFVVPRYNKESKIELYEIYAKALPIFKEFMISVLPWLNQLVGNQKTYIYDDYLNLVNKEYGVEYTGIDNYDFSDEMMEVVYFLKDEAERYLKNINN